MSLDHLAKALDLSSLWFPAIGRIAIVIFVYELVKSVKVTSDIKAYNKRLLMVAILSQVPYSLLFESNQLNILFTLSLAVLMLSKTTLWGRFSVILFSVFLTFTLGLDNSFLVLIMALLFEMVGDRIEAILLSTWSMAVIYIMLYGFDLIHAYMIMAVFFIYLFQDFKYRIKNSRIFYWYYPVHLIILKGVQLCL